LKSFIKLINFYLVSSTNQNMSNPNPYKIPILLTIMANTFLFHKVSEKEKEEIKKQAKSLLDEFGSKLEKIKTKDSHFQNKDGLRGEGDGWDTDKDFRDIMMSNAPFIEDDFLVAEKGGWK